MASVAAALLLSAVAGAATGPAATPPALGASGTHLTIDGAPRFLILVSYFDALRATDQVLEEDFAWLRTHGIDGVRVFPNWWRCTKVRTTCGGQPADDTLLDPGGALRPDRLARLRQVLDAAGRHGLVVDLSFARETVPGSLPPAAYAEGVVRAMGALGAAPHVMVDLQNEVYMNRVFADDAAVDAVRVAALARRVDGGSRLVFVSTNVEEAEAYTYCGDPGACPADAAPLDVIAVHDARRPDWHDRTPAVVRDLLALAARRGPRPVYLQEPQAWQDEQGAGRLERFLDAAARARRAGAAAWTFHTRSGFILARQSMRAQATPDERAFIERVRARVDASPPR